MMTPLFNVRFGVVVDINSSLASYALRAPGSNMTWAPELRVVSVAENSGVTDTVPVNVSAGPGADGRDSFGEISMCCARKGAVEHARTNNTIVILEIRMTSPA